MINKKVRTTDEYKRIYEHSLEGIVTDIYNDNVATIQITKGKNIYSGLNHLETDKQTLINISWLEELCV